MRLSLSARGRLTLVYTVLFTAGGTALIAATYLLVAHALHGSPLPAASPAIQQATERCVTAVQKKQDPSAIQKCGALYASGVRAGATAQRQTTLTHLLTYSIAGLACTTVLSLGAGWLFAGRILRPLQQLIDAARTASETNLSQRIALSGPRDELRELADTFDAMLDRLEHAFTSQRQFIANASHELRTPLTVMRTAIDVVIAKPNPTPGELVSMSLEVRQAVEHAQRLIEALLLLARNEQDRTRRDEPLDLATVAEDVLDQYIPNDITITRTLGQAPVSGDALLLETLASNLLDNATRYNLPGGRVTVSTTTSGATSQLRVVNTGPVVPPDQVDRLLLPFTRLDDRIRHDGVGLGLALVCSISAVHEGTVHPVTIPTGGLDITVRLPRRRTGT
jgi:signal transduction histidine kinase